MTGSGWRRRRRANSQSGQAAVEALIVLPVVVLTVLLVVQLLWLVFANATFRVAVSYSLRAGSINHGSRLAMERTLVAAMASLEPVWFAGEAPEPSRFELRRMQLKVTAKQWLHYQLTGRLQVHRPTAETSREESERRYDLTSARWLQELAIDHARTRTSQADAQRWQRQRELDIEVWWCLPLEVPFAAQVLSQMKQWWGDPAQRHCAVREQLLGRPMWALQRRLAAPLQSGYREGLNP
ncbi:hypothetical protein PSI9734_00115 [Pseudidiomarina piscicola]|uniref:TadE-like domain-containing protein n=1 Tax=Pseudidiomarina piscicola TaxID=2614830 RepID=A0A7D9N2L2_9GAMM|nr:TadE/TadG family type IV pilus assembly protein [Pseudidiomarina piscicola]CAB0149551.1 hypothetical protein PSI9734_00115 [Pseudidiomarina piscicola]VZT38999.1 hypothetical protein PSI9734_00115 [Pseudomonas aeruginosa]